MKYAIEKDKKRRIMFCKTENHQIALKTFIFNRFMNDRQRFYFTRRRHYKISNSTSLVRIKNRCIETGRAGSVYRFCRFSRIRLRQVALRGDIAGVRKASW